MVYISKETARVILCRILGEGDPRGGGILVVWFHYHEPSKKKSPNFGMKKKTFQVEAVAKESIELFCIYG
jgi:hypothetical protein